jgi:hypothetical protein
MADKVTFDPINLIIAEISVGGDNEILWQEIYSEWKAWLLADLARLGYPQAFRYVGSDPISPVQNLGSTFFLMNGWRVRPAELSHKLTLVGNCFVEGGIGSVVVPTLGAHTINVEMRVSNLTDAVLINSPELEYASFNGGVTIDVLNGYAGTGKNPDGNNIGTPLAPSNNLTDAMMIALIRGFKKFFVIGNLLLDAGGDYHGMTFIGESMTRTVFTISNAANVSNCVFQNANVNGYLDGGSTIRDCVIGTLYYADGYISNCLLAPLADIHLSGAAQASIIDCWCDAANENESPIIDMGGVGSSLVVRGYAGSLKFINKHGPESASVGISEGHVVIESSCDNGSFEISGQGFLTDNSTAPCTVDSYELINTYTISSLVERTTTHLRYLIESQGRLTGSIGTIFYWSPLTGNDLNDGLLPTTPCKTFTHIHDNLVVADRRDVVFALENLTTERLVITKNQLSIRCMGRAFSFSPTIDSVQPTITIRGCEGILIEGGSIESSASSTACILLEDSAHCIITGSLIYDSSTNGVKLIRAEYSELTNLLIQECAETAISITDGTTTTINHSTIRMCPVGIMDRATVANSSLGLTIDGTLIRGATTSLDIGIGCLRDTFRATSDAGDGAIINNGTDSHIEIWEQQQQQTNAVWNVQLSNYLNDNTTGGSQLAQSYATVYGPAITVDTVNGSPGSIVGENGTIRNSVNNLADALILASTLNIRSIVLLHGTLTLNQNFHGWTFNGSHPSFSVINLNGQRIEGSNFTRVTLIGACGPAGGNMALICTECILVNVVNLTGYFVECGFVGTTGVGSGAGGTGNLSLISPKSASGLATFSFDTHQQSLNVSDYIGDLSISGCDHASTLIRAHLVNGTISFENTCLNGTAEISGAGTIATDNSGPNFNVNSTILADLVAASVLDEPMANHSASGTMGELLSQVQNTLVIHSGQAQSGGPLTIQFDLNASDISNYYNHMMVVLVSGTGAKQVRVIQSYDGPSRTASVVPSWVTVPDNSTQFSLFSFTEIHANEVHEPVLSIGL